MKKTNLIITSLLFVACASIARAQENAAGTMPASKGNAFNPDISANFLGLAQYGSALSNDRKDPNHSGLSLQEAEFQFVSDVDVYFRASALFSVAQNKSGDYGIDPEEVFLETISIPNLTLKAGKFKAYLGKHNTLHTHAYPFIDAPLINQILLGDEGLNEAGVSAAYLVPFPWYSELTLQALSNSNEELYDSPSSKQAAGLAHFKNLWDLSDDLTAELGLSGTGGKNATNYTSYVVGADLTFKWRPTVGGKYHALIWSSEYLYGDRHGKVDPTTNSDLRTLGGLSSWLQWQFAERWWAEGRYENVGIQHSDGIPLTNRGSVLLGFFPSEFSGLRLQYSLAKSTDREKSDHYVGFQYNISIGAHPAHAY